MNSESPLAPLAPLALVAALVLAGALPTVASAQDGRTYAQSDVDRARQVLRAERERRALDRRRAQEDAELANPRLTERERRALRERWAREDARQDPHQRLLEQQQREDPLGQAERERRRQRGYVDPTHPAGRDPVDPRFAPGGVP